MAALSRKLVTGSSSDFIQEPVAGSNVDCGQEPKRGSKMADWCWVLTRRCLPPDDVLFEEGDIHCHLSSKYVPLEDKKCIDASRQRMTEFSCDIAKCSQTFDSLAKFESHYSCVHYNVCQTCHRFYPSAHLLELHVLETHDVMFALLANKQNMFQCLLEDCVNRFAGSRERRKHMISVHKYPANYRYDNHKYSRKKYSDKTDGKTGINPACTTKAGVTIATDKTFDKQNIGIMTPNSPTNAEMKMDVNIVTANDVEKRDKICDTVSMETEASNSRGNQTSVPSSSGRVFSYKVPQNLCFGQGVSRGFVRGRGRGRGKKRGKHWHNSYTSDRGDGESQVNIETVDMMELSEALPT